MSNIAGLLSTTKVIVEIEETLDLADYAQLPGEASHSKTETLEAIEVTNKSLADTRCYLEGEGRQLLDLTVEAFFNSETTYGLLRTAFGNKAFVRLRRTTGSVSIISQYIITGISDTAGLNAGLSESFTLSSHGTITVTVV